MKKIGIFGGSFDPVHNGHLSLAKDALEQAGLHRVVFVPAGMQPFKLQQKPAAPHHRLNMLKLATQDVDEFQVSSYEIDCRRISYTYLTLEEMQKKYGRNSRLYFITGSDAFLKIKKWRNRQQLLTKYSYIIGNRPGYREEELQQLIAEIISDYGTDIMVIQNRQLDVSSTQLRNMLESREKTDELLHFSTERYINENGLYR